ncbi:integrase core domain-containing protein, partial [Streptomyces atratus]
EARREVFRWITRYNTRRRHTAIGNISPITFERRSVKVALAA